MLKYLFDIGLGAEIKFVVQVFEKLRTLVKDSEPFKVFEPIFEHEKKFVVLPFSVGNKSRCAGVTTLSSNLFWYNFQRPLLLKLWLEEKLYFNELPVNDE